MIRILLSSVLIFQLAFASTLLAAPGLYNESVLFIDESHPVTGESGTVVEIATWRHILYVLWRENKGDGAQFLESWDIRDPKDIKRLQSYPMGHLLVRNGPNSYPRDLFVSDGHLIYWRNGAFYSMRLFEDGRIEEVHREENYNRVLGQGSTMISSRDRDPLTMQFHRVVIDYSNPAKPYRQNSSVAREVDRQASHFVGESDGLPVLMKFSADKSSVDITTFERRQRNHYRDFWKSKVPHIFKSESLDEPVGELFDSVVESLKLDEVHGAMLDLFLGSLDSTRDTTLRELLTRLYSAETGLSDIMADFDIQASDSLEVAFRKVIEKNITNALDQDLANRYLGQLFKEWRTQIFAFANVPINDIRDGLRLAMNAEMLVDGNFEVLPYFVERYISPLLGNPDYLTWRLERLVDEIDESEVARLATDGLKTFDLMREVKRNPLVYALRAQSQIELSQWMRDVLDFLEIVPLVGDIDLDEVLKVFVRAGNGHLDFFNCFVIPDNARTMVETALYNNGAGLQRDAYALFEMIKLALYYIPSGGDAASDQFDGLLQTLENLLMGSHELLSNNIVDNILGSIDAVLDGERIDDFIARFAKSFSFKYAISSSLSEAFAQILKAADLDASIRVDTLLNEIFDEAISVNQEQRSHVMSDARDINGLSLTSLLNFLDAKQLATVSFAGIFDYSKEHVVGPTRDLFVNALRSISEQALGDIVAGQTLGEWSERFIRLQVDGANSLSPTTDGMFNRANLFRAVSNSGALTAGLKELAENVEVTGIVGDWPYLDRVADGDCIATYRTVIDAFAAVAAADDIALQVQDDVAAIALEIMNAILGEIYDAAISYLVSYLVSELITEIFFVSDARSWHGNTYVAQNETLRIADVASFVPTKDPFALSWEDKKAIFIRNVDSLGPVIGQETGSVALLISDPKVNEGRWREVKLGDNWVSTIIGLHFNDGAHVVSHENWLALGGRQMIDGRREAVFMLVDMNQPETPHFMRGAHVTQMNLSSPQRMSLLRGGKLLAVQTVSNKIAMIPLPTQSVEGLPDFQLVVSDSGPDVDDDDDDRPSAGGGCSLIRRDAGRAE
jgi:hypothetical protein